MRKKLLLLGSSLGSVDVIRRAKALGCHTIVTDYLPPEESPAKREADEFWMLSTGDLDALEKRCRAEGVDAVFAGVSEFNLDNVWALCDRLGLPRGCAPEAWSVARNKYEFKRICREVGVPVAREFELPPADDGFDLDAAQVEYPVVVKPVDGCGNAGVSFCFNRTELAEGIRQARAASTNPRILVEEYLRGTEYCNVYAIAEGEVSLLSIRTGFMQPGYPSNLYSLGTTVACHIDEYLRDSNPGVMKLFRRIGCRDGIAWIQGIRDERGRFCVLEMGYRLSAEMMYDELAGLTGFDAVRWVVELQLGQRHTAAQLPPPQTGAFEGCASAYMLFAARGGTVAQIRGAEQLGGREDIRVELLVRPGDSVKPFQLLGKLTFQSENSKALCATVRHINETLGIFNTDGADMILRFTEFDRVNRTYRAGLRERGAAGV